MKVLLLGLSLTVFNAWAEPSDLTDDYKQLLKQFGVGTTTEQTFCYKNADKIEGYQIDKLQRIASVTKLFTSLLASENLDLHKQYKTKIFISGTALHIQGGLDPYFEEEKMLLLMKALNEAGYKSFSKVTIDKDFIFSDQGLEAHREITASNSKARLSVYLNAKNQAYVKSMWRSVVKFGLEEGVDLSQESAPALTAPSVTIVESNPLLNKNPIVFEHTSKPLHAIMKSMNVMSKNIVAHNLYLESSRVKSFASYMKEVGISATSFKIYNGSGLPIDGARTRLDNLASCRLVLLVIEKLEKSLKRHNLVLSDVVAINGGKDLGSFRTRFGDQPETHEAVLSKTGTLKHASSLAGVLLTDTVIPFAILNHTVKVANARKFQDEFVARMFHHLGDAVPLDYSKISIFPWDETDFLQPITKI